MREPLLAPFVAVAGGVVAARYLPFGERELSLAAGLLVLLTIAGYATNARWAALAACLAALFFAGALSAVLHRPGPPPELDAGAREVVILGGCVVEPSVFSEEREQFTLEIEPGARARVSLYAKPGEPLPDLRYGQRIELEARVRRTHTFRNPGAFDYAAYLARQSIFWNASGKASGIRKLPGTCGSRFFAAIFAIRGEALRRIEQLYRGDSYSNAMMQAVLIGESSGLETVWTDHFRRTGTYHALVISGQHVAVLAAFFLFLLRICLVPQTPALTATSLMAWLYALVSGWQAPVVRSAAGFTLFVIARWFYRKPRLLNVLAAVALGFVALDPDQLFDASFQLSFLSVAALGAIAAPLIERTSAPLAQALRGLEDTRRDPRFPPRQASFRVELRLAAQTLALATHTRQQTWFAVCALACRFLFYVYELFVVSAAIQFGLALPMAIYFHRLSITGLSANLLIVPLLSAVVPVGFVAIFTAWTVPATVAGWLLAAAEKVAAWHVRWEPDWRIPDPPAWLSAALALSLVATVLARRLQTLHAPGGIEEPASAKDAEPEADSRPLRWLPRLGLLLSTALLGLLVWHPFPPRTERGMLELTAIDVGQAESLFLAFPDGRLMLLDAGGFPASGSRRKPRLEIGEDVVSPYLWTRSIRRLDTVALSHIHSDHMGGMRSVLENFRPRELWTGAHADTPEWRDVQTAAARLGVHIVMRHEGERFTYGGAGVSVLAPTGDRIPSAERPNNDSLVLRLTYGEQAFLLTGDIEKQVERVLLEKGALSHADVLKVPHHGSKTSSTAPFLDVVRPAFALISAGPDNQFGNPHPAVIEALSGRHTLLLRTDEQGLLTVRSDGLRLRFETPCAP